MSGVTRAVCPIPHTVQQTNVNVCLTVMLWAGWQGRRERMSSVIETVSGTYHHLIIHVIQQILIFRFPPNCPTDKCKCYPTSVDGTNNHVTDSRPSQKPFWFLQQPQQQPQFYSLVPGPVLVNPGWRQFRWNNFVCWLENIYRMLSIKKRDRREIN